MEERALILLGILMAQSQHGYQINEFIEKNLSNMTDMKKATAYNMLEKLSALGHIDVHIEQEGNRPPRKVYSVNEEGTQYFLELLRRNLESMGKKNDPIDIGLMFLDYLPLEEAIVCLEARLSKLYKRIAYQEKVPSHGSGSGVDLSIERNLVMLQAECEWLTSVISRLQNK